MITREDILEYSGQSRRDPFWVENDYLQNVALVGIYTAFGAGLVFKGGTALQKVYGLGRLSRDLDFNLTGASRDDTPRAVDLIGDYYPARVAKKAKVKHGIGYVIAIKGPSYSQTGEEHKLPLTLNTEEPLSLKPVFKTINPGILYRDPDLRPYSVLVMDIKEILAEKVRALVTRKEPEPRDLYDIRFILENGVPMEKGILDEKMGFAHAVFSKAAMRRRIAEIEPEWDRDLGSLVDRLPDYKETAKYVVGKMEL
jgi:hypothetical protein